MPNTKRRLNDVTVQFQGEVLVVPSVVIRKCLRGYPIPVQKQLRDRMNGSVSNDIYDVDLVTFSNLTRNVRELTR